MKNRRGQEVLMWALIGIVALILTGIIVLIIYSSAQKSAQDNVVLYIIDNSTMPNTTVPIPNTSYIETPNISNVTNNNNISPPIIIFSQNISNTSNTNISNISNTSSNDSVFVNAMLNLSNQMMTMLNTSVNATFIPSNCTWHLPYPDPTCTPGIILTHNTSLICIPGYATSVRNVSQATKDKVYKMYGISTHITGEWEIDHLIPLSLGGSNDIANLWPEPSKPYPGFYQKDRVEQYFYNEVCAGRMSLDIAQMEIVNNWVPYLSQTTNTVVNNVIVDTTVGDQVVE